VQILDRTSDTALAAGLELPAANDALKDSLPQVVGTVNSLTTACSTLRTLGTQLSELSAILRNADPPLKSIVAAARGTNNAASDAQGPIDHVVTTLGETNGTLRELGARLDESLADARAIEAKLRIVLVLPPGTG
jgi:ABC-type transporter Mla subunit MlaD